MDEVQARNAPSFGGWFMAAGAAAVGFGVAMVLFDFSVPQASLVAAVLLVAVGLILGQPDRPMPARQAADRAAQPVAIVEAPVAPMMAAPVAGKKPEGLAAARGGRADDLKIIKGIGPSLEKLCHSLGYFHFDQIANWTPAEIAWVDDNLEGFKGRVTRDEWVSQARVLAAGGTV